MKLSRKTIAVITTASVVALIGLVVLQVVLLQSAYESRRQAFERNVHAAMNAIAQKLEVTEAVGNVFRVALEAPPVVTTRTMTLHVNGDARGGATKESIDVLPSRDLFPSWTPIRLRDHAITYTVRTPQHVTLRVIDLAGLKDTVLVDEFKKPGEYVIQCRDADLLRGDMVVRYRADSASYVLRSVDGDVQGPVKNVEMMDKRREIVGRVVDELSLSEREPIEKRIRPAVIDSVVSATLRDAGIDLPFAYGIASRKPDSLAVASPAGFERELLSSGFRSPLFPSGILFGRNELFLFFPGEDLYLLKQVGLMAGASVLFMGMIVVGFAYTIRTVIRQKQFSVRLVDFINNMTHEFKTPISTIAVATETIARDDVVDRPDKVLRYSAVIQDENARMKKQVDAILQMALLEEGEYDLKLVPVDVHDVIRRAAESVALRVDAAGGGIEYRLEARRSTVMADAVHLAGIFSNVLDNACKYSPERPAIVIATADGGGGIRVDVSDRGIGIGKEDQVRVFEKYYRVPTGNRHDVKGFGLGLAYVKLMTEAHGGHVSLTSEPGSGTTVHITLPPAAGLGM